MTTNDKNPLDFEWDQKTLSVDACDYISAVFKELFDQMPKTKLKNLIGHANDIYLFFETVKRDQISAASVKNCGSIIPPKTR